MYVFFGVMFRFEWVVGVMSFSSVSVVMNFFMFKCVRV